MRIVFESGHVNGAYPDGRLTVAIAVEDETIGQTVWDDVSFSVPDDFHAHNDSVAAALMTLAGKQYDEVTFNFPISTTCAETLRSFYGEIAFDPVDPSLEPRKRGSRIGLLFSGGVDSTGAWIILNQALGEGEFAVITNDYGPTYAFEARGYEPYRRDVTCRTDLRAKGWDGNGRFTCVAPLLYADYLGLSGICTGHTIAYGAHFGSLRFGSPAVWRRKDPVLNAGGLDELHVLGSITTMSVARLFLTYGRERIEDALNGSAMPARPKRYTKELIFRKYFADAGLPLPRYLSRQVRPKEPIPFGQIPEFDYRLLYLLKHGEREEAFRICPDLAQLDLAPIEGMALNFLDRYSTNITELLPLPLRIKVMDVFHEADIYPYDERDWHEIGLLGDYLIANGVDYVLHPPD